MDYHSPCAAVDRDIVTSQIDLLLLARNQSVARHFSSLLSEEIGTFAEFSPSFWIGTLPGGSCSRKFFLQGEGEHIFRAIFQLLVADQN